MIELYRATGNARWLAAAQRLADTMVADFQDSRDGGFFFTIAEGHEQLLTRSKNVSGGGNVPKANGVAAQGPVLRLQFTELFAVLALVRAFHIDFREY